jgi:hypothetical protein
VAWRWKAPRRERALYRLGELAPAGALTDQQPGGEPAPAVAKPASTTSRRNGTAARRTRPTRPARPVEAGDLMAAGRAVAAELAGEGRALTRAVLVERLRARGVSVSNARAGALLAQLRSDDEKTDVLTSEGVA